LCEAAADPGDTGRHGVFAGIVRESDRDLAELVYIVQHRRGGYWNEISGLTDEAWLLVALASADSGGIRARGQPSPFVDARSGVLRGSG
jgi:hypothetical protein